MGSSLGRIKPNKQCMYYLFSTRTVLKCKNTHWLIRGDVAEWRYADCCFSELEPSNKIQLSVLV